MGDPVKLGPFAEEVSVNLRSVWLVWAAMSVVACGSSASADSADYVVAVARAIAAIHSQREFSDSASSIEVAARARIAVENARHRIAPWLDEAPFREKESLRVLSLGLIRVERATDLLSHSGPNSLDQLRVQLEAGRIDLVRAAGYLYDDGTLDNLNASDRRRVVNAVGPMLHSLLMARPPAMASDQQAPEAWALAEILSRLEGSSRSEIFQRYAAPYSKDLR